MSPQRRACVLGLGVIALLIMLAGIYAFRFSRFVPSEAWNQIASIIAVGFGVLGVYTAFLPENAARPRPRWLRRIWVRAPGFAVLFYICSFAAFATGLPAWYTALAGSPAQRVVTVESWRFSSVQKCSGPELIEAPWVVRVCLSVTEQSKSPPGTKLILVGNGTALGINVEAVRLADNP